MTYQELIYDLGSKPALIDPGAYARLLQGFDLFGEEVEMEGMEIDRGIAFVPISGIIGRGISGLPGCADTEDIWEDIDEAEKENSVKAVMLVIDSPGGMVNGTPEVASRIGRMSKPVFSYSAGDMCSAAYWIGVMGSQIYASQSANIGSIGVYSSFLDMSRMAENMGLKVEVFSSGKYKGMGVPGTSLTPDQRALMQSRVEELAGGFQEHVSRRRQSVDMDSMQGQAFTATQALSKCLIDGIEDELEKVAASLR